MLPERIRTVLTMLEDAGYEAYLVGGCVRDPLIGREVSDYDVTTSALPEEVERVFEGMKVIETGIKHGTVTVLSEGEPVEITTFRTDGEYLDSRHPESVSFTRNIADDLSRRDFTVNSIAVNKDGEYVDPYGGREDIARRVIRCTGDPDKRFGEDALRIIRALRFSSVLGFEIEEATADSIHRNRALLSKISVERVFSELKKLLCGENVFHVLTDFSDAICTVVPEMAPCVGFDQKSVYHVYDVYTHIAKTVEAIEPDETLRLAMLFHDIGKPHSYQLKKDGVHYSFHGHPEVSADIAKEWLDKMHADGKMRRLVPLLCRYHDRTVAPTEKSVKKLLRDLSYDEVIMLCKVQKADSAGHAPGMATDRGATADVISEIAERIVSRGECFSLRDLAVNGNDLAALGFTGRDIGAKLHELLDLVIDERLPNERQKLLGHIKKNPLQKF